jgi:phage terminase large subunit
MIAQELRTYMPGKARRALGSDSRYKVLYGGRGGGKSYAIADALIALALYYPKRILCTREMQNSIKDSVHRLLRDRINDLKLDKFFIINKENIYSDIGAEFIFKGLHSNINEIKSTEGIDICWVEEAEKVSEDSWTILVPTIREPGSQIWVSFNPEDENSATHRRFIVNPPDDCASCELIYEDNKYFPEVLRREMEYDRRVDPEKYMHVWLGKCKKYGQACMFKRVRVEDFDDPPADTQFFYGADFGFSVDPTCLIKMFIQGTRLYIINEAYGHGVEITELPEFFRTVPGAADWKIIADSERPDTISYLHNEGFEIEGAEKGKGSVEDGIQFLNSFEEIIIHSRCPGAIGDFRNCRWKTDKTTGDILPIPLDKSNHAPDAARYALEPYIKRKVSCWDVI